MVVQPGGRVQFRTRSRLAVLRESTDDAAALAPQLRTARSLCATGCCPAATWAACLRRAFAATRHRLRHEAAARDRKSTRLNSSHVAISYAVFCLKKKKN